VEVDVKTRLLGFVMLISLSGSGLAVAADACDPWQKLADGRWYLHCIQEGTSKNICYFCSDRQVSKACTKQEGSVCAR